MTYKEAIEKVITEISTDRELFKIYQSRIAVEFFYVYSNALRKKYEDGECPVLSRSEVHKISNDGAERFLNHWCSNAESNKNNVVQ